MSNPPPVDLDLTTRPGRGPWRTGLRVATASTLLLAVICVIAIPFEFLSYGVNGASCVVVAIVAPLGALFSGLTAFGVYAPYFRPLVDRVPVDEIGLSEMFAGGTHVEHRWEDTRTRFTITELTTSGTSDARKGLLRLPYQTWIDLSAADLEAVKGWVNFAGAIRSSKSDYIRYRGPATSYLVRGGRGIGRAALP